MSGVRVGRRVSLENENRDSRMIVDLAYVSIYIRVKTAGGRPGRECDVARVGWGAAPAGPAGARGGPRRAPPRRAPARGAKREGGSGDGTGAREESEMDVKCDE